MKLWWTYLCNICCHVGNLYSTFVHAIVKLFASQNFTIPFFRNVSILRDTFFTKWLVKICWKLLIFVSHIIINDSLFWEFYFWSKEVIFGFNDQASIWIMEHEKDPTLGPSFWAMSFANAKCPLGQLLTFIR